MQSALLDGIMGKRDKYVVINLWIRKGDDLLDFLINNKLDCENSLGETAKRLLKEYKVLMSWESHKKMIKRALKKQMRKLS